jgi:hypothetical protein
LKGTIDFQYDFHNDLVVARPRWHIDTPAEALRWYQMHARYFTARFSRPKDMIVVEDAFDVAPEIGALWRTYCANLQEESLVRFSIYVKSRSSLRPTATARGPRHGSGTIETPTVEDAVATIMVLRQRDESMRSSSEMRAVRPSSTQTLGLPKALKKTK